MCGIGTDWLKEAAKSMDAPALLEPIASQRALIVFVKNPILGQVKTRLAKVIGDEAALAAYQQMLRHMHDLVAEIDADRWVYYAAQIDEGDLWERPMFHKAQQATGDVGHRMAHAFQSLFAMGYSEIVLVGSDFLDLQIQHLNHAFRALKMDDFVLGPAHDGGYYLIGMKAMAPQVFEDRHWSHAKVLEEALSTVASLGKTAYLLPILHDIDEAEDWFAALERRAQRLGTTQH